MLQHTHPRQVHSHNPTSELDMFLDALTSPTHSGRGGALDSIIFAAAAASGPAVTRHHLYHHASARKSMQMPRSQRLQLEGMGALTPPGELETDVSEGAIASSVTDDDDDDERAEEPAIAALSADSVPALVDEEDEDEDMARGGLLSGRSRTPPTPPLAPTAKRQRAFSPGPDVLHLDMLPHTSSLSHASLTQPELEVKCMARTRIPTNYGPVFLHVYHNNLDNKEHLAIVADPEQLTDSLSAGVVPIRSRTLDAQWHPAETAQERLTRGAYVSRLSSTSHLPAPTAPSHPQNLADSPLVRIHSECFTGETLGSLRCDCGEQLDSALALIAASPSKRGIVLYLRQEGRGIGLLEKVRAYNLQDMGLDTVQANLALGRGADERAYGVAAAMLRDLGVGEQGVRLMTNNPAKVDAMQNEGIRVRERVGLVPRDWVSRAREAQMPITAPQTPDPERSEWETRSKGVGMVGGGVVRSDELEKYLRTKVERMGHLLDIPGRG